MDGPARCTGLSGILVGAGALYHVMKRRWWALAGLLSTGAAGMLSMVTEGPRPPQERTAVRAVLAVTALQFHSRSLAPGSAVKVHYPTTLRTAGRPGCTYWHRRRWFGWPAAAGVAWHTATQGPTRLGPD
jgi:hypothetical protein